MPCRTLQICLISFQLFLLFLNRVLLPLVLDLPRPVSILDLLNLTSCWIVLASYFYDCPKDSTFLGGKVKVHDVGMQMGAVLFVFTVMTLTLFLVPLPFNCTLNGDLTRHCYEQQSTHGPMMVLDINTTILRSDGVTRAATYSCGAVLNCQESPCNSDLVLGREYQCQEDWGGNYYIPPSWRPLWILYLAIFVGSSLILIAPPVWQAKLSLDKTCREIEEDRKTPKKEVV